MAGPAPVAIIMGSQSDWATMRHAAETLDALGVGHEARIVSAHRTPDRLYAFAKGASAGRLQDHHRRRRRRRPSSRHGGRDDAAAGVRRAGRIQGARQARTASIRSSRCRPACRSGRWPSARPGAINAALLAAAVLALADDRARRPARRLASAADRGRGRSVRRTMSAAAPIRPGQAPSASSAAASSGACWRLRPPGSASLPHLLPRARQPGLRGRRRAHAPGLRRRGGARPPSPTRSTWSPTSSRTFPRRTADIPRPAQPLRPGVEALATTQDRFAEKSFVAALGIATAPLPGCRRRSRPRRRRSPRSAGRRS